MARVRIYGLPVTALGELTRAALRDVVGADDVAKAHGVLALSMAQVAEWRTLRDRPALRNVLLDAGFALVSAANARPDIDRLTVYTDRTIRAERRPLVGGAGDLHLERPVTAALLDALARGNVVLTGEAGSGKTIVMLDAAEQLRTAGATVAFLNAELELPRLSTDIEDVLEA